MYDILELLYDYSMQNKRIDRYFIDRVLEHYWNGLKGYLESIKYESIKQTLDDKNLCIPAGYIYLRKRIVIDEKIINEVFPYQMLNLQMNGFYDFDRILAYNVQLLHTLLHEIDHALQYKKGKEKTDTFEGLLLSLCFYPEHEMWGKGDLQKYIYLRFKFMRQTTLGKMHHDFSNKLNDSFSFNSPYERLAQIDSGKQVLGLLEMMNADMKKIPKVLDYYKHHLLGYYMQGYDKTKEIPAPTMRYLKETNDLGYKKLNKIATNIENRIDEITIVDDKMKYGLDITDKEFYEFKGRILK